MIDNRWKRNTGEIVPLPYYISIGRREWYWHFALEISSKLGSESYLLDFLLFPFPSDSHANLYFFIESADRIDIHLKGISFEQLKHSAQRGYCVKRRADLGWCPYMSLWEINQIVYRDLLDRSYWHVSNSLSIDEAHEALGGKVPLERLSDEIQVRDEDISCYRGVVGTRSYRRISRQTKAGSRSFIA